LSAFINQFQEYRQGFLARQAWEQEQIQSLSMADRMAVAKEKVNEQTPQATTATPQKTKKRSYENDR